MYLLVISWVVVLIVAYLLIYLGADRFIDTLGDLSVMLGTAPFVMGLVVLGIDPEESIASITAAINRLPYVAVGNVIGNSIIALTLGFGIPAIFYVIEFQDTSRLYKTLVLLGTSLLFLIFLFPLNLLCTGIIALSLFGIYTLKNLREYQKNGESTIIADNKHKMTESRSDGQSIGSANNNGSGKWKLVVKTILLLLTMVAGGWLLIYSTQNLITLSGLGESFFGFIVIAFVTNAEEITLIVRSVQKGKPDIGVGAMVGKIIWNLGFTFGISGIILFQATFGLETIFNLLILLGLAIYTLMVLERRILGARDGIVFISFFILFLVVNFVLIL